MQPLDMTIIQTPGRGLPYKKDGGARRKFWKKALRYQDPAWWAWLVIIFCHIFAAQYPKRYSKSSHCGPFETAFSTPKGAMRTPSLLYGSPPPPQDSNSPMLLLNKFSKPQCKWGYGFWPCTGNHLYSSFPAIYVLRKMCMGFYSRIE